jgi:predicted lipid-binding transport protein (Tim44 family)
MQSGWIEIVFLAMLAGFIALRLYSVLGRRTGHEKPVADPFRPARPDMARPVGRATPEPVALPPADLPSDLDPALREGLSAVMAADRGFAPDRFLEGARQAYRMILEAFWAGESDALNDLVSDDVQASFRQAIAKRTADGERLDNKLLSVNDARIVGAQMNGTMAEIMVRFDAEILAVTRDAEGRIISGDPNDTVETHDVWTFSRHTATSDPAWLLVGLDDDDA